jgi:GNAT superfamily N-acetyltransferase
MAPDADRPPYLESRRVEVTELTTAHDVASFSCGKDELDEDLNEFLRDDALRLQSRGVVRVFVARYEHPPVLGYVALATDVVPLKPEEKAGLSLRDTDFGQIPALKLARLAVSEEFRRRHRGLGKVLVAWTIIEATELALRVGCRLVTVDAYPKAVGFYESLGFIRNTHEKLTGKGRRHVSMRFDIRRSACPQWMADLGIDMPIVPMLQAG